MRPKGAPEKLEHRRRLAVRRYLEGDSADEIAELFDVSSRTVWRWLARYRAHGPEGLLARPAPGRPPKLTSDQEQIVFGWLRRSPIEYGFTTESWTGPLWAQLIQQEFGIRLHPRYLYTWLRAREVSPQAPLPTSSGARSQGGLSMAESLVTAREQRPDDSERSA